ncbi:hypothetical protein [Bifidobacterium dentium]|uniref:hypothetical protein n=1 Tax=Bifidobacterium dentium TaxID=1689 RepID=UPI003D1784E8
MSKDIPVALTIAAPLIAVVILILAIILGTYVSEHTRTVILHSDTGDYACTVSPLSHNPTNCKPIEGMK